LQEEGGAPKQSPRNPLLFWRRGSLRDLQPKQPTSAPARGEQGQGPAAAAAEEPNQTTASAAPASALDGIDKMMAKLAEQQVARDLLIYLCLLQTDLSLPGSRP
jgi:hypothetical protein